jgi:hypothetical protein
MGRFRLGLSVLADFCYEGIGNLHKEAEIPKKRPRGSVLTREDKERNRALSKVRVVVENILGDEDL